jgi:hypothetical protein
VIYSAGVQSINTVNIHGDIMRTPAPFLSTVVVSIRCTLVCLFILLASCSNTNVTEPTAGSTENPKAGNIASTVTTVITVAYEPGGVPVVGANVYNHNTNALLGSTNSNGVVSITTAPSVPLRVTEPDNGSQSAIISGFDRAEDGATKVSWTLP